MNIAAYDKRGDDAKTNKETLTLYVLLAIENLRIPVLWI